MSRKKLLKNWQGEVAVGTLGMEPKIVYYLHVPQFCSSIFLIARVPLLTWIRRARSTHQPCLRYILTLPPQNPIAGEELKMML